MSGDESFASIAMAIVAVSVVIGAVLVPIVSAEGGSDESVAEPYDMVVNPMSGEMENPEGTIRSMFVYSGFGIFPDEYLAQLDFSDVLDPLDFFGDDPEDRWAFILDCEGFVSEDGGAPEYYVAQYEPGDEHPKLFEAELVWSNSKFDLVKSSDTPFMEIQRDISVSVGDVELTPAREYSSEAPEGYSVVNQVVTFSNGGMNFKSICNSNLASDGYGLNAILMDAPSSLVVGAGQFFIFSTLIGGYVGDSLGIVPVGSPNKAYAGYWHDNTTGDTQIEFDMADGYYKGRLWGHMGDDAGWIMVPALMRQYGTAEQPVVIDDMEAFALAANSAADRYPPFSENASMTNWVMESRDDSFEYEAGGLFFGLRTGYGEPAPSRLVLGDIKIDIDTLSQKWNLGIVSDGKWIHGEDVASPTHLAVDMSGMRGGYTLLFPKSVSAEFFETRYADDLYDVVSATSINTFTYNGVEWSVVTVYDGGPQYLIPLEQHFAAYSIDWSGSSSSSHASVTSLVLGLVPVVLGLVVILYAATAMRAEGMRRI